MQPNEKPGWQTTEFWVAGASQLLALLMALGVLNASDMASLSRAVTLTIGAVATFAANVWVIVQYIQSRTALKVTNAQLRADDQDGEEEGPAVLGFRTRSLVGGNQESED